MFFVQICIAVGMIRHRFSFCLLICSLVVNLYVASARQPFSYFSAFASRFQIFQSFQTSSSWNSTIPQLYPEIRQSSPNSAIPQIHLQIIENAKSYLSEPRCSWLSLKIRLQPKIPNLIWASRKFPTSTQNSQPSPFCPWRFFSNPDRPETKKISFFGAFKS